MAAIITPLLNPFAFSRGDNVAPAYGPGAPDNIANQTTGFPVLQKTPLSTPGAIPVKEEEMNGVLNFYTNMLFQLGEGFQFTFNGALSTQIGGYPQGAVLWNAVGNNRQVSLIANNTFNFVSTPSYINDGIHWKTVTDTPSINNPSTSVFLEAATSTVNSAYQAKFTQTQISSADVTNGQMNCFYGITDGTPLGGSLSFGWNVAGVSGVRAPNFSLNLASKTNKLISLNGETNTTNGDVQTDWAIYSSTSPLVLNTGFGLIEGKFPYISGDLTTLTVAANSVVPMSFLKNLRDPTTGISGIAIYNGTKWGVSLSGLVTYSGGSTSSPAVFEDLTIMFGVTNVTTNFGTTTSTTATQISGGSSIQTVSGNARLAIEVSLSNSVTSCDLHFSINFECDSLT